MTKRRLKGAEAELSAAFPIFGISHNGHARMGKLYPDLMMASCEQTDLQKSLIFPGLQHFVGKFTPLASSGPFRHHFG